MQYQFKILGNDLTFSDEKLNYVRMKSQFKSDADKAEEKFAAILPPINEKKFFFAFSKGLKTNFVFNPSSLFSIELKIAFTPDDYKIYSMYTQIRDRFIEEYCNLLKDSLSRIVFELEKMRIYVDTSQLLEKLMSESKTAEKLNECANYIRSHSKDCATSRYKYYSYLLKLTQREKSELSSRNDETGIFFRSIVDGVNKCFIALCGSNILDKLILPSSEYELHNTSNISVAAARCAEILFSSEKIQETLRKCLWNDIFSCCNIKAELYSQNDLKEFQPVTMEEKEKAAANFNIVSCRDIPEEDAKDMLAEALKLDPSDEKYYFTILDRYGDQNGDLQNLASLVRININDHIEKNIMRVYETNNIADIESVKNVKAMILAEEKKYRYTNSKAHKKIRKREIFIKYTIKASKMTEQEIVDAYSSIKNGCNSFVDAENGCMPDDKCLLVLARQIRIMNASKYQEKIVGAGLCDDSRSSEKCYGFYIPNKKYLSFENECEAAVNLKIPRDTDLSAQNYSSYRLASGEVILGYFSYSRNLDVISNGSELVITNKRIYTKKYNFVDISEFSECRAVKKLTAGYLSISFSEGREVVLPVPKEKLQAAADMINKLIYAVKGEVYIPKYVEPTVAEQAVEKARNAVKGAAGSAKKEINSFVSAFTQKFNYEGTSKWNCACGKICSGAFCSECGRKRPD